MCFGKKKDLQLKFPLTTHYHVHSLLTSLQIFKGLEAFNSSGNKPSDNFGNKRASPIFSPH
jgi:hypothetical protein